MNKELLKLKNKHYSKGEEGILDQAIMILKKNKTKSYYTNKYKLSLRRPE